MSGSDFCKPEKCSLFLSCAILYTSISFAFCSLPKQLPTFSCLLCAITLWPFCCEGLFPVNALAAFFLFPALTVKLFHLLQASHTTEFIVLVQDFPQLALTRDLRDPLQLPLPLKPWYQLPHYLPVWHLDFLPLLLSWKTFWWNHCVHALSLAAYSLSFRATTLGSNKLNMMQIWWQVLFPQCIYLGVENRRRMLNSRCGIILPRSLNTRVKEPVPVYTFLAPCLCENHSKL